MDNHQSQSNISRRTLLVALIAGTAGGTTRIGEDEDGMSEPSSQLVAQLYRGALSDRPDSGVEGRYYHVTTSGSNEGDIYRDTGSSWEKVSLNVQLGTQNNPAAAEIRNISGVAYARNHNGDDLNTKIVNALDSISNQGTIRITPKHDGSAWKWTQDVALDLIERNGAEITVADNAVIEYTGDGTMLTIDNTNSVTGGHPGQESRLTLRGGLWRATGDNPDCWIRIKDSIGCEIYPNEVGGFSNTNGDGTAVSIENHRSYSENTHVSGRMTNVDRGIDFVPQSVTGGNGGTESFHDTYLENVHINFADFGIRLRGAFDYSLISKPSLFAKSERGDCLVMDTGRADGTVITAMKCESPDNASSTAAIKATSNWDQFYAPTIIGGRLNGFGIDHVIRKDTDEPAFLGHIRMRGKAIEFINWGTDSQASVSQGGGFSTTGDLSVDGNIEISGFKITRPNSPVLRLGNSNGIYIDMNQDDFLDIEKPYRPPQEDLSSYGNPGSDRVYIHHSGGDGNPEGMYYSDLANNQWVELAGSHLIPF